MFGSGHGGFHAGAGAMSSFGVRGSRLPAGLKFDGTVTDFPSWRERFAMHARQCGLYEAYTTTDDIPVVHIGVDLAPLTSQGFTVGEIKRAQAAWWHLDDCITSKSVRAMVNNADSPSKAWRVFNDHFLPLMLTSICMSTGLAN